MPPGFKWSKICQLQTLIWQNVDINYDDEEMPPPLPMLVESAVVATHEARSLSDSAVGN